MFGSRAVVASRSLARHLSTTNVARDVSKLTLVGRLGADPTLRTASNGKDYYQYTIATSTAPKKDADGNYSDGTTSWHNVYAFNEGQHEALKRVGKGSTVYVEADLEMRKSDPIGDQNVPDRVLLRQLSFRPIVRSRPEGGEGAEAE